MCETLEENIEHFMSCIAYWKISWDINWKQIFGNNVKNQNTVAKEVKTKTVHKEKEARRGWPASHLGSTAPNFCSAITITWLLCLIFMWKYTRLD